MFIFLHKIFNNLPQFLQEIVNTDSFKTKVKCILIQKEYYTDKDFIEDYF